MQSFTTFSAALTARMMNLPSQAQSANPLGDMLLEGLRQRNAMLDYLFYDLAAIKDHEAADLAPYYGAKGAVICVYPSDYAEVHVWPDYDGYRASSRSHEARTLAVAGVGSSALGAAAFARNVADAVNAPVLTVVSGYGIADMISETMGGFFMFGTMNPARHMFDQLDEFLHPSQANFAYSKSPALDGLRSSVDVKTVVALLAGHEFDMVVGHSRGNLVIAEALTFLTESDPDLARRLAEKIRIVTIGGKVEMPAPWRRIVDVMGENDQYGLMNSSKEIATDIEIAGAGHHTNTELPMHLDVTNAVAKAMNFTIR